MLTAVAVLASSSPDVAVQHARYKLTDRNAVVIQVPRRTAEELAARAASRRGVVEVTQAVSVARQDIERARSLADPRYLGRAQAMLAPWWDLRDPPPDVLLLRATIKQSLHEFHAARMDLDQLVRARPRDIDAHLTRAVVATVSGDYEAARQSCAALAELSATLIATACAAPLDALHGREGDAYEQLAAQLARTQVADPALRGWITTILAELAIQAGAWDLATSHLRTVLAANPGDLYALGLLADLLLASGNPESASIMLAGHEAVDGMLLRRAIAELQARGNEANTLTAEARERFATAAARGDRIHLREEARFALDIEHDPQRALGLAVQNWAVQRELADARLLASSAVAARDPAGLSVISEWITTTGVRDVQLDRTLAGTR